ncbi:methylated-DNA--[protein]-cysteine S-methyltransferase [Desulfosporosinus shakirovi]|uniref:methylated-DNA--[protein]-cysteine S-methyltransferase n=1 Tax=Desulfosporosinus shakirovi TaxID=2885154 RepID=UPI001E417D01|nr:methylated-DNA--[protein]-cysteine S-methyltransferase [Desulfosporosinus sp. SRJS8]MCB8817675.1 methylated-DNA--[protein]-cysteine S-methyltransferase [Desulfosporosinus sp. SRJS8]
MKNVWYYDYPIGTIGIAEENGALCHVFLRSSKILTGFSTAQTPLIREAARQLGEYFDGRRKEFDLPLSLHGTEFQQSVWEALQAIPVGETCSYKDIAVQIGNPRASRAVGTANKRNPVIIIIPCHRVVGQDGSLTGYVGGLPVKQYLLELEKRYA